MWLKRIAVLFVFCSFLKGFSQDSLQNKYQINISADLVSSYIWRGIISDLSPSIQPSLSFEKRNFKAGFWGSSGFTGAYKEADIFLQYTLGSFTLGLYDYFWVNKKYFEYDNQKTGHVIEPYLIYGGTDKFPVTVTLASWVYGDDKAIKVGSANDTSYVNRYSSYMEVSYGFMIRENKLIFIIGGTPEKGYYGEKAGIVNVALTGEREMKITDRFSIPLKLSFITNPLSQQVFFVAGITF